MSTLLTTGVAAPPSPLNATRASRPQPKPTCRHCGAQLIDGRMRETGFCCAGCSYVYRLVHEHGLAGYYRIKDDVTAPADAAVFQPRDYAWLEDAQREAEGGARSPSGPGLVDAKAGTQAGSPVRQAHSAVRQNEPVEGESRPHLAIPELTLDVRHLLRRLRLVDRASFPTTAGRARHRRQRPVRYDAAALGAR